MGAYGSSPSPSSTQSPESRRPPASFVRRAASSRIRVLPTPDSPATKTSDGRPAAASVSAASSSASSAVRPIILLDVILAATAPVSRLADGVIGVRDDQLCCERRVHLELLASVTRCMVGYDSHPHIGQKVRLSGRDPLLALRGPLTSASRCVNLQVLPAEEASGGLRLKVLAVEQVAALRPVRSAVRARRRMPAALGQQRVGHG